MKKTLGFTSLFVAAIAFAQGISFEKTTFTEVLAKAKKENKLVFLDAYASWCGPCKLMDKNIFSLANVGEFYNGNFVNAKIDMEKGEGVALAKKYGVAAYPTYLFINGEGEEVHRTLGYVEEPDFIQFGKDALDPSRRISALKQQFEDGKKEPDFLFNLAKNTIYSEPDFAAKVLTKYFEQKTTPGLSNDELGLLVGAIRDSNSPLYTIFVNKKDDVIKITGNDFFDKFGKSVKTGSALTKAYNKDTKTYDEKIFYAEALQFLTKEEADKILLKNKANRALKDKDYATYEKLTLEANKDYSTLGSNELNSIAWSFFENVKTPSALKTALAWAQESVKLQENSANTDTLANLYNKLGDKANAKIWAIKAIELAKKSGDDYESTQKLLDTLK